MPEPRTSSPAVPEGLDLDRTLASLRTGVADPCWRATPDGTWWWATRTPEGPATLRLVPGEHHIEVSAWGDGALWAEGLLPGLLGHDDDRSCLSLGGIAGDLVKRFPGFRMARTSRLGDAAIVGVCCRGVSAFEAGRSWSLMVEALGDDAPGPGGLRLPPNPRRLAATEPYDLHVMGLEHRRADEVRRIASHAPRLESGDDVSASTVVERLRAIAGLGADAIEHARSVALGEPDALPIIDAHHRAALIETLRGPDGAALDAEALLEPHRPQRGRVVRLVGLIVEPTASGA